MMNVVEHFLGPLAGAECRRALAKPRWVWLRLLTGLPGLVLLLIFVWIWWVSELFGRDSTPSSPAFLLRIGVTTIGVMVVAAAMILAPATLAATLASEKDRGTLAMLLTTRVSPREIVFAKLASRLLPVLMLLLAALPALGLMAGLPELGWRATLLLCALPLAVAWGGAGLALAVSTVARKGRDALLTVYILEVALVLLPLALIDVLPRPVTAWLLAFNPFYGVYLLAMYGVEAKAVLSLAAWGGLGVLGVAWSAWRLAPIYLRQLNGGAKQGPRRSRRTMAVGDSPMLWKELHSEQSSRSRLVRWLGWLLIAVLSVTALALGAIVLVEQYGVRLGWVAADANGNASLPPQIVSLAGLLRGWALLSSLPLSWLVQWAVGMRAAVAIAAEREQHTWDMLLTTPLEGHEIVGPKIAGSLWSMKLLLATALVAWGMGAVSGAIEPVDVWNLVSRTVVVSAFMAAVGAWASAQASTAAKAMTVTLGMWLAAMIVVAFVAWILTVIAAIVLLLLYALAESNGWYVLRDMISLLSFGQGYQFFRLALYVLAAFLAAWYCRRNFDALAGRNYIRTYIPPPPNYVRHAPMTFAQGPMHGMPLNPAILGALPQATLRPAATLKPVAEMPLSRDLPPIPGGSTAARLGESAAAGSPGMPAIPVVMSTTLLKPDIATDAKTGNHERSERDEKEKM